MLVSWRIDRILVTLLAVVALGGTAMDSVAQQEPKRPSAQKPAKPPPKTTATTTKPKGDQPPAEAMTPSQIGIPTLAQYAFMVDP